MSKTTGNTDNTVDELKAKIEEEKKKQEEEVPEPNEEVLSNPCRIVPKQITVIQHIPNQDYIPLLGNRLNGFVLLKKVNETAEPIYFDEEKPVVENINANANNTQNSNVAQSSNYAPLATTDDVEMPEEFDINEQKK